ncbi:hypothetical protein SVIOM342S_08213 [Streptomyces violaceorubidus]
MLRLSDETETLIGLAQPDAIRASLEHRDAGCLAVVGFEGTQEDTAHRREEACCCPAPERRHPRRGGAGAGCSTARYSAPYLRYSLLDAGALAETLETAAHWSRLPALYAAVREALTATLTHAGTPPLVMCHISHVYENGASLYFTVVSAQGEDPVAHGPWSARGQRRHPRRGRHHHPPPRGGHRPPPARTSARAREAGPRRPGPARRQAEPGPRRDRPSSASCCPPTDPAARHPPTP